MIICSLASSERGITPNRCLLHLPCTPFCGEILSQNVILCHSTSLGLPLFHQSQRVIREIITPVLWLRSLQLSQPSKFTSTLGFFLGAGKGKPSSKCEYPETFGDLTTMAIMLSVASVLFGDQVSFFVHKMATTAVFILNSTFIIPLYWE